ncbi:UDP-glcNAc:betaGal beta-1 3-N-acetylglucosaminyltransferase 5A [Fasciola hepatica]|uniref:Hexosyltransferase n=1 Tax=Fasciola hepatica TaxID=6192 RepID=A0A4E0RL70_FASHE|nr:UDP-glcNAc:betaGal beta-1 3-N-acetylglucosaminyltransferase 5A [Fasciola hepatica]
MRANLWGSFRVQFVFVVGLPGSNQSEWMQFEGLRVRNPTKVFKDAVATRASLLNESDHFRDMLIGDFIDSYYNLTLKQVMTFRWVSAFCRYTSPVYFFIDNDYSLVPSNVIKMIKRTPDKLKLRLNGGTFGPLRAVLRPTNPQNARRWDMSVNEIPWTNYPQYSSGAAYVVGASLVTDAAIAMAYTRFLRFDDAYLGFVWNKLHAPVMIIPGMKHTVIHSPLTEDAISIPFREADQLVDWSTGTIRKKTPTDTKLKKKKE